MQKVVPLTYIAELCLVHTGEDVQPALTLADTVAMIPRPNEYAVGRILTMKQVFGSATMCSQWIYWDALVVLSE